MQFLSVWRNVLVGKRHGLDESILNPSQYAEPVYLTATIQMNEEAFAIIPIQYFPVLDFCITN